MRTVVLSLGVGFMAWAAGCSEGGPVQVEARDGPAIRADGLESRYAWVHGRDSTVYNADVHKLVVETIDKELAKKGFEKSDSVAAGFWIEYHLTRDKETDASVSAHGIEHPVGTVVVRLLDPATRRVIWEAYATARIVANAPPDERKHRVEEGVHRMFQRMPPRRADGRATS